MLEFYDSDDKIGTVTLYDRHLLLNSKLIKYFEEAYKVRVGLDKELNEVYIFPIDKDHALSGELKESSLFSSLVDISPSLNIAAFTTNLSNCKNNTGFLGLFKNK